MVVRNALGQFTKNTNGKAKVENKSNGKQRMTRAALCQMVNNTVSRYSRRSYYRDNNTDPRRDIDDECGYPPSESLTAENYRELYERFSVARRVVEIFPKESWKIPPVVFETEDTLDVTPFEEAWQHVGDNLRGKSWFNSEDNNPVFEYLMRVDIRSGIGSYGILLLGIDDGKELNEPLEFKKGSKLLYLRVFDETLVQIQAYEQDTTNERFGKPTKYQLTFSDSHDQLPDQIGSPTHVSLSDVHWTRIIHVADNLGSSELFGTPRMKPNYNHLYSLRLLYGGSGEMYYKGAFPGLALETHPQLGGDVEVDIDALRTTIESYMNGLQRYMVPMGMHVNSLSPQVVDPTPQIDVHIEAICIEEGYPKRIFTGSERGELASSQDARAWNGRLSFRNENYTTPRIISPFVDRLISVGVLPEPKSYDVAWADLNSLTDLEKAEIAVKQTDAFMKYIAGGVDNLIHPLDFFTKIIGLTQEESMAIIDTVMKEEKILPEEEDPNETSSTTEE